MDDHPQWVRAGKIPAFGNCPIGDSFRARFAAKHAPDRAGRTLSPCERSCDFSQGSRNIPDARSSSPLTVGRRGCGRRVWGAEARKRLAAHFSIAAVTAEYEQMYDQILEARAEAKGYRRCAA